MFLADRTGEGEQPLSYLPPKLHQTLPMIKQTCPWILSNPRYLGVHKVYSLRIHANSVRLSAMLEFPRRSRQRASPQKSYCLQKLTDIFDMRFTRYQHRNELDQSPTGASIIPPTCTRQHQPLTVGAAARTPRHVPGCINTTGM